jgi:hypothetical protein
MLVISTNHLWLKDDNYSKKTSQILMDYQSLLTKQEKNTLSAKHLILNLFIRPLCMHHDGGPLAIPWAVGGLRS